MRLEHNFLLGFLMGPFQGHKSPCKGKIVPQNTNVEGPRAVASETENSKKKTTTENSDLHTTLHNRLQVTDLTQINGPHSLLPLLQLQHLIICPPSSPQPALFP